MKGASHKIPHTVLFPLYDMSRLGKAEEIERLVGCLELVGGCVWGKRGATSNGGEVSFGGDKNILKLW